MRSARPYASFLALCALVLALWVLAGVLAAVDAPALFIAATLAAAVLTTYLPSSWAAAKKRAADRSAPLLRVKAPTFPDQPRRGIR